MTTFAMPTGSNVSRTMLRVRKFWRKCTKLGVRTTGPYNIEQAHVSGTLTIELHPSITERISVCNVIPYRTWMRVHFICLTLLLPPRAKTRNTTLYIRGFQGFPLESFFWNQQILFFVPPLSLSMAEQGLPWKGRVSCPCPSQYPFTGTFGL
jgi:hypothetical protein